jgi:protein-tyrosine phosphatase
MVDITEIVPGLWQGADPGKELPSNIGVVVNLACECPIKVYHENMVGVLWMPTQDGTYPGAAWLDCIVRYIIAAKASQTVLVHCVAGRSRSTLVVAAYLMATQKISADAALTIIHEKRPIICPAPEYLKALHEYEHYVL